MKKNEINELKNKAVADLMKLRDESRVKLRGLLFDLQEGKIKNVKEIRGLRKLIARAETFLKQR